jgi:serine phosphatase RsbU (regulator of sigma subunit)
LSVPDLNTVSESKITLSHKQNALAFEFVALNYIKPEKNRYAYRLLGLEKAWIEANTRRSAAYANLAPGQYSFQVKGSNNDGLWNETPAQVDFTITPPWWRTWPAYLALLMLFGGSLLLVRRYEMGRERQKADLVESELRLLAAESQARALQAEHQRKTQELEEARLLQLSMLPTKLPDIPGWELSVFMSTASEVGGDYYDFHPQCREGLMTAVVGDATGHGLKAGTLVAVIKGLFMAESSDGDFKTFMKRCSTTIKRMHLGNLYMGLILLRLGPGRATLCSAGMPPVIHFEAAKGRSNPIHLKGLPLGAYNSRPVPCQELTMAQGDSLLLLSDGLAEAFNEEGQMFGYQRIQDIFTRAAPQGPEHVISALTQASQEWLQAAPPEDDITLMVLRYLG